MGLNNQHKARLYFAEYASPLGVIMVASTYRGITRVAVRAVRDAFIRSLQGCPGAVVEENPAHFRGLFEEFDAYFSGRKVNFNHALDVSGTVFEKSVWAVLTSRIPYGEVKTYGQVARAVGSPLAARAVGSACGKNPVPIIVPCHRVLKSSGAIGGYSGGVGIKRALLEIEGRRPRKILGRRP